jgi:uncharacterized protein
MADILKEILKELPSDKISDAAYEGANIVLYTKKKEFFFSPGDMIKGLVDKYKKRVELRPDPSITLKAEETEKIIKKLLPKEAKATNILFDHQRSHVIIEAEKPGLAIGKQGSILREIREKTLWIPTIRRMPAIRSQLIESIRNVLYDNSNERRRFLNKVGHRVYDGWLRGKKNEWVRITYLGGGRSVGKSCILLQTPESRILLDCGIDIANNDDAYPFLECPEFRINELDAVIVTHSHLDHCGCVPLLFKYGYKGPIYCTSPTRDVMALLQLDFVKIQVNSGQDPIYTSTEVEQMVKHTITLNYEEVTDITPDVRITLYDAGHILGSSMIHMHIGNGLHNLLYSGDMKYGKTLLLDQAHTKFPRLETLMIESTYGGRDNVLPPKTESDEGLGQIMAETVKRGGKALVPVLGVGRAQEVMLIIDKLIKDKKIDRIPVYIDGMVYDVTAIHTAYPEFLNKNLRKQIFHKDQNPFLSDVFSRVGSAKERRQIIEEKGACVIVATSGMLVGGASVEYLKALADNPKNSLVFVNYQGAGSLGRRIQMGEKDINMGNTAKPDMMHVKMEIHVVEGFSGHSDRNQLMNFVARCEPRPRKVIVNHGESSRCLDLASSMHKQYRVETVAPRNLEAIRIR